MDVEAAQARLDARMQALAVEIARLEAEARASSGDDERDVMPALDTLKHQYQKLADRIAEMDTMSGDATTDFSQALDIAFGELETGVRQVAKTRR